MDNNERKIIEEFGDDVAKMAAEIINLRQQAEDELSRHEQREYELTEQISELEDDLTDSREHCDELQKDIDFLNEK